MARYIEIVLEKRDVHCAARLMDDEAPRTCDAVWDALPQTGGVYHAKYASNEIYALVSAFAEEEPGPEHRTIVPACGDVMYFYLAPGVALPSDARHLIRDGRGVIDLAVFYDHYNLLLSPREGLGPGNVFARIVRNMEAVTEAGHNVWREGFAGEQLTYRRLEGEELKEWGLDQD